MNLTWSPHKALWYSSKPHPLHWQSAFHSPSLDILWGTFDPHPPPPCSPWKHVKIFRRPHSQVISNDWFPKRPSEREEAALKETVMCDSNCPATDLQLTVLLTTNATWLNSITAKLINQFAWARPKKFNLKLTLCFTLMMAFAQVIEY